MTIIGIIGIIILFCYALRAWTFFVMKRSIEFTIQRWGKEFRKE
jgi:branched-subunit amino acid transport protein AzlD